MTIGRHDGHPPEVICRPAGTGLCERLPPEVSHCIPVGHIPGHGRWGLICVSDTPRWHNPAECTECGELLEACRCERLPSKVPNLRGVPLEEIPALGGDEGPSFGSAV